MKKSDIADRVADRTGVSRPVAKNAVDAVFEAMGETLAKWRGSADHRIRNLRQQEPSGPHRAQSGDRREPVDRGFDRSGLQAGQDAQGRRERKLTDWW